MGSSSFKVKIHDNPNIYLNLSLVWNSNILLTANPTGYTVDLKCLSPDLLYFDDLASESIFNDQIRVYFGSDRNISPMITKPANYVGSWRELPSENKAHPMSSAVNQSFHVNFDGSCPVDIFVRFGENYSGETFIAGTIDLSNLLHLQGTQYEFPLCWIEGYTEYKNTAVMYENLKVCYDRLSKIQYIITDIDGNEQSDWSDLPGNEYSEVGLDGELYHYKNYYIPDNISKVKFRSEHIDWIRPDDYSLEVHVRSKLPEPGLEKLINSINIDDSSVPYGGTIQAVLDRDYDLNLPGYYNYYYSWYNSNDLLVQDGPSNSIDTSQLENVSWIYYCRVRRVSNNEIESSDYSEKVSIQIRCETPECLVKYNNQDISKISVENTADLRFNCYLMYRDQVINSKVPIYQYKKGNEIGTITPSDPDYPSLVSYQIMDSGYSFRVKVTDPNLDDHTGTGGYLDSDWSRWVSITTIFAPERMEDNGFVVTNSIPTGVITEGDSVGLSWNSFPDSLNLGRFNYYEFVIEYVDDSGYWVEYDDSSYQYTNDHSSSNSHSFTISSGDVVELAGRSCRLKLTCLYKNQTGHSYGDNISGKEYYPEQDGIFFSAVFVVGGYPNLPEIFYPASLSRVSSVNDPFITYNEDVRIMFKVSNPIGISEDITDIEIIITKDNIPGTETYTLVNNYSMFYDELGNQLVDGDPIPEDTYLSFLMPAYDIIDSIRLIRIRCSNSYGPSRSYSYFYLKYLYLPIPSRSRIYYDNSRYFSYRQLYESVRLSMEAYEKIRGDRDRTLVPWSDASKSRDMSFSQMNELINILQETYDEKCSHFGPTSSDLTYLSNYPDEQGEILQLSSVDSASIKPGNCFMDIVYCIKTML